MVSLFVGKPGQVGALSVESAPWSSVRRLLHRFA